MSSIIAPGAGQDHLAQRASGGPQLRTLLLTDLVESTALVERLGDGPAAELFRAHDHLVLQLQQQWRGRLIDRSDGLLLLFERAIDGLGFALDYTRGLRTIGGGGDAQHHVALQARIGLHVGEVLSWRNSDAAVTLGAKPLEVEGLAKPFAARLMTLARPGQILLSAVAEPLAHRAARELGPRGEQLLWKSYGRWCFKGIPEAQEIYEVGEAGIAPLRAPKSTAKSWRDIPFWRRPAALGAELLLVAGLAAGTWFLTRPQPAIAFAERDWVVVGDLRNLTGDSRYDNALDTALRLSLEQSRYVNVIPDVRVNDTLKLMRRDATRTRLDRSIGSEVAQRIGARALLLPTVADVSGRVQISVEVVDPATQATVYAESASGQGADSAVQSAGQAATALRKRLGEALDSIQASAAPVEQVTTSNLDALRAFTLGQEAYALQKLDEAKQQFDQALSIDPGFAMARIGLARVAFASTDAAGALQQMQLALQATGRLTDRERLYAQASLAQFRWDRDFLGKWIALANLYPDFHVAAFNAAHGLRYGNRYRDMLEYSDRATAVQAITRPAALYFRAIAAQGLGQLDSAERDFRQAQVLGFNKGFVEAAFNQAAARRFAAAAARLRSAAGEPAQAANERAMATITIAADAGQWDRAAGDARKLLSALPRPRLPFDWAARATILSVLQRTAAPAEVRQQAGTLVALAESGLPGNVGRAREAVANAALYAGYVAAGRGEAALARRALAVAAPVIAQAPQPVLANLAALVRARLLLRAGDPRTALETLQPYRQPESLLLTQVVAADAQRALGNARAAGPDRTSLQWRGRAYAEWAAERPPVIDTLVRR